MHGDKGGRWADHFQAPQLFVDGTMVGPVNRVAPGSLFGGPQVPVARHNDAVTEFEKRARVEQLPIAVNDQARVSRQHCRDAEVLRKPLGQGTRADVDSQVATPRERIESHVAERLRKSAAGMVANEQDRHFGQRIDDSEGWRLASGQQGCGRVVIVAVWHV